MTKPLKKKVHQISSNNGSDDMKHSHHSQCSIYFKGDAFLGWMRLELQSEGLLPDGLHRLPGYNGHLESKRSTILRKDRLSSSVHGFVSGIQSDTVATSGSMQVLFSPPTRPSEDSTILKTSWSPATWTKPGKFQSIDGPLLCCHVLKIFEERAMTHDVYNRN